MLDDKTLEWLEEREWAKGVLGNYSCMKCQYRVPDDLLCIFRRCPKENENFRDAAEFEARVAAKLANYDYTDPCLGKRHCPYAGKGWTCRRCNLKQARLAVEAEMEQEKGSEF